MRFGESMTLDHKVMRCACLMGAVSLLPLGPTCLKMPGCTLSDHQKKKINRDWIEECVRKAVEAYHQELLKEPEVHHGLHIIAEYHGIKKAMLAQAVHDKQSIAIVNQKKQKLLKPEEDTHVDFILQSDNQSFPFTCCEVESYANSILAKRVGCNYTPVGKKWIYTFLNRNQDKLQTHWSKLLNMQRAQTLNPEAVKNWFDLVEAMSCWG